MRYVRLTLRFTQLWLQLSESVSQVDYSKVCRVTLTVRVLVAWTDYQCTDTKSGRIK